MFELIHADCRAVMANMGDNTVDSIVTDPPYHLTSIVKRFGKEGSAPAKFGTDGAFARASRGFMGKEWDGGDIAFDPELWAECLRVLKPGGHLIAFSGSRTYHRMAYAIDLAGFEIRDQLLWLYGSGFPKSHDVSKALDRAAGVERGSDYAANNKNAVYGSGMGGGRTTQSDPAVTPEGQQWAGWGTALKPAHEPMVLARKPLDGTVAANVLAHGVGALNIDGCRVPTEESTARKSNAGTNGAGWGMGTNANVNGGHAAGRFPANVLHDGSDPVLDGMGEPARFFYCAKASRADREAGLDHLEAQDCGGALNLRADAHAERVGNKAAPRKNPHPTVKPTDLMRWLVRLVTPPGGLVFDPFTGSGSTGRAALMEGCRFIGAEMTAEYIPVARARIASGLTPPSSPDS